MTTNNILTLTVTINIYNNIKQVKNSNIYSY